jgi:HEAT repeat protein
MRRRSDPTQRLLAVRASTSRAELTRALDDPSPAVARAAAARLVKVARRRAAPPLRERLLDAEPAMAAGIARALRSVGDPTVVDLAIGGLRDNRYPRRLAAARALEALGDPRARDALCAALRDSIAGVRAAALSALAELGRNEQAALQASALLTDPSPEVRLAAVSAVARTARHPGTFLVAVAQDPDRRVRLELGRHLAALPDAAATLLLTDGDLRVREAAARGAGSRQVRALAVMLGNDRSRDVRCAAAQALRDLVDERTAELLLPGLEDPDAIVRAAVIRALATSLGTGGAVSRLCGELGSRSAHRRRAAIYALGHLEANHAGTDVARRVDDPDPEVRMAVIHTAASLHADPEPLIRYMAADLDPAVRHSAETWLEREHASTTMLGGSR